MYSRTPNNYDPDEVSLASGLVMTQPSLAQQQFKDETDINTIARKFGLTGNLPTPVRLPTFGDFTDVSDFQSALHAIQSAQASFDAMPSAVRERFRNDPQAFVAFCSDSRNADELRSLGLANNVPPVVPKPPDPVNP